MIKTKIPSSKILLSKPFFKRRIIISVLVIISIIIVGMILFEKKTVSDQFRSLSVPGKLITINDTQKVHLNCAGEGKQTVIFESGMGGTSLDWARVQPKIAKETRVCSYDRPGYGWSDEAKSDRNASISADDLYTILQEGNIQPPYVMVGASYGGLISRLFTARHIDHVTALIQIDPSHESDFNLPDDSLEQLSKTDPSTSMYLTLDLAGSYLGITRASNTANYSNNDIRTKEQVAFLSSSKNFRTMLREYGSLTESTTLARDGASSLKSLQTKYILTSHRFDRQKEFCSLSTSCSAQNSGNNDHLIPQNKPDLVVSAVNEAIDD